MSVIYVTQPGAELGKSGERLRVRYGQNTLASLPIQTVERVVILGQAQVTAAAVRWLLETEIPLFYCTQSGRYLGTLSAGHQDALRTVAQVNTMQDSSYRLAAGKVIVQQKLHNQRAILKKHHRQYGSSEVGAGLDLLERLQGRVQTCGSIDRVRGVEGRAGAIYFSVFDHCIYADDMSFHGRNRRPPRDPVNALLSLGYMLLLSDCVLQLHMEGLHLGVGYIHETSSKRPSLALDMMELFRQPLVDRLVLALINKKVLQSIHFTDEGEKGCRLAPEALKTYLQYFERAITTECVTQAAGKKVSFREMIRHTALQWRQAVEKKEMLPVPDIRLG